MGRPLQGGPCPSGPPRLRRVSTLAIVLIVVGVVVLLLFTGGLAAARRRDRLQARTLEQHIREADRALQEARAEDKGWDRPLLEATARQAIQDVRPGWPYDRLDLVLVDDRPGVEEDRAHFVATGPDARVRVVLGRREGDWVTESVD
jgi:hypothetical protein